MKKLTLVLTAAAAFALTNSAFALIYNPLTGNWYGIVDSGNNGSWANAEANAISLGGHLVTINDQAEEEWLRATFGYDVLYWIGFTDAAEEGKWVWSSGQPVTYLNWDSGEPNNCTPPDYGEDYAVLNWNSQTGGWNDWDHLRPDYYRINGIAEIPGVPDSGAAAGFLALGVFALVGLKRMRRA